MCDAQRGSSELPIKIAGFVNARKIPCELTEFLAKLQGFENLHLIAEFP